MPEIKTTATDTLEQDKKCHSNPPRVTSAAFVDEGRATYDKEKYWDMLGYFGFDRTLFGGTSRIKNRKWWYQLREQRQKDIDVEKSSNI